MKGFTSAYKRMRGDLPSSALTTNLSYVMSDQKVHPTQHRPLSLLEAMMLHTISDFEWKWELPNGKQASDKLIRESIGESIPPRGLLLIFQNVFGLLFEDYSYEIQKISNVG
jgi:DNA (cytosine-5)-methyltransferase 1